MDGFLHDTAGTLAQHLIGYEVLDAHLYSALSKRLVARNESLTRLFTASCTLILLLLVTL